jgi:acetolactate decarboxylase
VRQMATKSWRVEWFGSQGDFIAGKAEEAVSLERFADLESLYAVGPLEQARGEVSIYDSIPLISQVQGGQVDVTIDFYRHAAFLVYAIVEDWRRVTVPEPIETEQQLENQLVAWAVTSGIDVDQPFAFLLNGLVAQATFHVLCNRGRGRYNAELHEKSKVRFPIANESVEVVGFYSRHHRGIFTPRDSNFHMHVRTLDNRFSGHLEVFNWEHGVMLYLPTDASHLT